MTPYIADCGYNYVKQSLFRLMFQYSLRSNLHPSLKKDIPHEHLLNMETVVKRHAPYARL